MMHILSILLHSVLRFSPMLCILSSISSSLASIGFVNIIDTVIDVASIDGFVNLVSIVNIADVVSLGFPRISLDFTRMLLGFY